MMLPETLTIIFVVLKLTGSIDWAWWQVFLPVMIEVGFFLLLFVLWMTKRIFKSMFNLKV